MDCVKIKNNCVIQVKIFSFYFFLFFKTKNKERSVILPNVLIGENVIIKPMTVIPSGMKLKHNTIWNGSPPKEEKNNEKNEIPKRPFIYSLFQFFWILIIGFYDLQLNFWFMEYTNANMDLDYFFSFWNSCVLSHSFRGCPRHFKINIYHGFNFQWKTFRLRVYLGSASKAL